MKSSELWNKINEVKELAVIALTDFIKNKIKDSINILPYVEQGYCTCIDIYGTDKNGYGIAYNVNSIEVNNCGSIYITLSDSDEYYADERHIQDFNCEDLIWILDMLEELFDSINTYDLPILKKDEDFDNEFYGLA